MITIKILTGTNYGLDSFLTCVFPNAPVTEWLLFTTRANENKIILRCFILKSDNSIKLIFFLKLNCN